MNNAVARISDAQPSSGRAAIPPLPVVRTDVLDRNRHLLKLPEDHLGNITMSKAELISIPDIKAIHGELCKIDEPAPVKWLLLATTALLMAFPQKPPEGIKFTLDALVNEDLTEFSAPVIAAAYRNIRRTSEWFPTIAKIRAACEEERSAAKAPMSWLRRHAAEHERRKQEAARQKDIQAKRDARVADLVKLFGPDAPSPEDVDRVAYELRFNRLFRDAWDKLARAGAQAQWQQAIANGEAWAADVVVAVSLWLDGDPGKRTEEGRAKIAALWPTGPVRCESPDDASAVSA